MTLNRGIAIFVICLSIRYTLIPAIGFMTTFDYKWAFWLVMSIVWLAIVVVTANSEEGAIND